jgi:hypothetical protein
MEASLLVPVFWALGLFILYFVIRMAVRHGIRDADQQRWQRRNDGGLW